MTEYIQEESTIVYVLTLRSCNTMSTDVVSMYGYVDMKCPPLRYYLRNEIRRFY